MSLFAVQGQRIFARGGNWVPGDMAYGALVHDQARYRRLLKVDETHSLLVLRRCHWLSSPKLLTFRGIDC